MSNTKLVWTEQAAVISAQALARGSSLRGTLDMRDTGAGSRLGAALFIKIGRGGTTALAGGTNPGVDVLIRDIWNNDTATPGGGSDLIARLLGSTIAAVSTTVNVDSAVAQNALNVASITGFAADDYICIQDSGGGVTRLEYHRVAKTAAGILTLDRPLQYAHTLAQADTVRNKADVFNRVWVDAGSLTEVVIDYAEETAGESVTVVCLARTLDSFVTA